jgi:hypothetical protein
MSCLYNKNHVLVPAWQTHYLTASCGKAVCNSCVNISKGSIEINYLKPAFYCSLTPKYFYNRQSGIDNGKETLLNSGNYIALRLTPNERKSDMTEMVFCKSSSTLK